MLANVALPLPQPQVGSLRRLRQMGRGSQCTPAAGPLFVLWVSSGALCIGEPGHLSEAQTDVWPCLCCESADRDHSHHHLP